MSTEIWWTLLWVMRSPMGCCYGGRELYWLQTLVRKRIQAFWHFCHFSFSLQLITHLNCCTGEEWQVRQNTAAPDWKSGCLRSCALKNSPNHLSPLFLWYWKSTNGETQSLLLHKPWQLFLPRPSFCVFYLWEAGEEGTLILCTEK